MPRVPAPGLDAVLLFHLRHELFCQEVFIAYFAVSRIKKKGMSAAGREHHKVAHLALAAKLFNQVPATKIQ